MSAVKAFCCLDIARPTRVLCLLFPKANRHNEIDEVCSLGGLQDARRYHSQSSCAGSNLLVSAKYRWGRGFLGSSLQPTLTHVSHGSKPVNLEVSTCFLLCPR